MILEINKPAPNVYFYKSTDDTKGFKINKNNLFILPSALIGDHSKESNFSIIDKILKYLNVNLETNVELKNYSPFHETDQK